VQIIRKIAALFSVALILYGIIYNVALLPFSSPLFDFISWASIGLGFLMAGYLGRHKKADLGCHEPPLRYLGNSTSNAHVILLVSN